jgi:hypothetical protein
MLGYKNKPVGVDIREDELKGAILNNINTADNS